MKGLYIAPVDKKVKNYGGVYKKIQSQIQAFEELNVSMDYIGIDGESIEFIDSKIDFKHKHLQHYFFFRYILKNIDKLIDVYQFIYIRFSFSNPYMFELARRFTMNNKKVFIEIPTYPYESEIPNDFKNIILKKYDRYLWKTKSKWIYKLVLTNNLSELFGIRAINIFNGINKRDISIKDKKNIDKINLIGVANISKWHGYDRVITGIKEYYKSNPEVRVEFYIVGEGNEKRNLQEMVKKLEVEEYVHILGAKFNEELDKIYDEMHIGVSSLALFRAGGGHDPIKSKEFVAKGMPVIIGYKDKALSSNLEFIYEVPEDDSSVCIYKIVERYKRMKKTPKEIADFAYCNLTWESQIKKIIECI